MSTEANKQVVQRFFEEVVGGGRLDLMDELIAADFYGEFPISPEPVRGPDGYRMMLTALKSAFPDLVAQPDSMVAEGDAVVIRLNLTGTQKGQLMHLPPSGRTATWPVIHMMRVQKGRIVEDRVTFDVMTVLGQLGAVPSMA